MIETRRLRLRPFATEDYEAYRAVLADPHVMRFVGGVLTGGEDAWTRILKYAGHWALNGYGPFAVIEREVGAYIGEIGIFDFRRGLGDGFDGHPEAGWIFAQVAQGKGLAQEAASAAHDWFDAHFGRRRTVCMIDPDNAASLKLARKLGYAQFDVREYKGSARLLFERVPH